MINADDLINGTNVNIDVSYLDGKKYSLKFLFESKIYTVMLAQTIAFLPDVDMSELKVGKSDAGLVPRSSLQYAMDIEAEINSKFGLNPTLALTKEGDNIQ